MKRKKTAAKNYESTRAKSRKYLCSSVFVCGLTFFGLLILGISRNFNSSANVSAEKSPNAFENALYKREEFFGAQAILPLPTAEARENIAKLVDIDSDNVQVIEKLAELSEKLNDFDEAEKILIRLSETNPARLENLATFYNRRARFDKEAEALRKILFTVETEKRAFIFERLINLARHHDLKEYLQADFYALVARENPHVYSIFETVADNLIEEKNYAEALTVVREAKAQFPERKSVLLEKEVALLLDINDAKEAEAVYQAAFDPLWSETEAEKFYDFLSARDRLRAYGAEIKAKFERDAADFDAALRLAHYRKHDYVYGNDEFAPVILKLEQAKTNWTTEELVTVTRILLRENEGELASRFLYTLYVREDFKTNSALRATILYQLFEMFSDAENQRLPLTRGDLRFYEDVAKTDRSPGIATGILSLIFADTHPGKKLDEQETEATRFFNRAAAYRIFLAYKEEFPTSPELAQMYLDIVRLYAATKEPEIAESALNEFAQRYENASDYPAVALKLADAFTSANQPEKTREIYRKVLDYLGRQEKPLAPQAEQTTQFSNNSRIEISADANDGINVPRPIEKPKNDYYYGEPQSRFHDYLTRRTGTITYAEVLEKLVSALAGEKKTAEILALYSQEIQKYPDAEWLYERRLAWLEQTNLTGEQLQAYQSALARFQSRNWQDKLARWFLRHRRQTEFADFSRDLVGKLNDEETQKYLSQFVNGDITADSFKKQVFLQLYQTAHKRFPHHPAFVEGLLWFYKSHKMESEWRKLAAAYYFEMKTVREQFLNRLAEKGELREFLANAKGDNAVYELFRADASVRLSRYENAVEAYRKLNRLYPHEPEFSEPLINLTRSFGQKNRELLSETANLARAQADFLPSSAEHRTRSGEIYAELGLYEKSREDWEQLIATGAGNRETYLETATVYWDYFQYDDALRTIKTLREKFKDDTLYAFEAGAILESQHKQPEAITEYVRALNAVGDEKQKEKSTNRLATLYARAKGADEKETTKNFIGKTIDQAFLKERARRPDSSFLTLGYAEFLAKIKQPEKAESVLNRAVRHSRNEEFLASAVNFYQFEAIDAGEQFTLKRLAETTENRREMIAYRLQLAESFEENRNRDAAKSILTELVRKFPTNYGVLTESADFYSRLGFENESVEVLQNALPPSRGRFRQALAHKLAKRLIRLNRLDSAEQVLVKLFGEDKADTEIFGELAKIYVRGGDAESLRKIFHETITALKESDADRRELDDQIAALRRQMIDGFTRLRDYKSAVEQHIEIINREPDDEALTENAINYVRRYGGAETLLDYYRKTSAEAFKNYRWNVVLGRVYAAKNDWENAAENYQAAIVNQPEMTQLYAALAEVEMKRNNFDEALRNLDKVMELTNDAPEFVKKKIEVLKKAGRFAELEIEKAKLPAEEKAKVSSDQFAEAKRLAATEKEKARRLYREAFAKLLANPFAGELKAADISGYVQSVREEEPLDQINERLWNLREKLVAEIGKADSLETGEARKRLSILSGALTESVGNVAQTVGTDDERAALHQNLLSRIGEASSNGSERDQALSLIQDLSRRAGFGDLEEKILRHKLEAANLSAEREIHLQNLISFYDERGAYQKTFDVLEQYESGNLPLKAETARLVGNREKELEALRKIYWKSDKVVINNDEDVARYLEILHAERGEELKSLTEKSSAHQLQLINFLLGKGERELAHAAIENANLSQAWKVSRHAETSLALKEFDETADCYFCEALQPDSIGNLVRQNPDKKRFLINEDWFRLSREYGEWLFVRDKQGAAPAKFLVSMIENQPRNAREQLKLGEFYLERSEPQRAIEHFRLALEINPADETARANLGSAYYLAGKKDEAAEAWARVLGDEQIGDGLIYFQTLQKYNLAAEARENLPPVIVKFLQTNDAHQSGDFQNLIRAVAASFKDEAEKSAYFLRILSERPTDTSLARMLIAESLIDEKGQHDFYELLIERSDGLGAYESDYNFASIAQRALSETEAETIYDQENEYHIEEPESERFGWRKKHLALQIELRENHKAAHSVAQIEKDLKGRYARPAWLRLAKIQLQLRARKFDSAEAESFIGIAVGDSATEIKLPSVERFNEVLRILKEEKRPGEATRISQSFYARMLALGQFETANFIGIARLLFEAGENEKALGVLQLMIDAGDEAKKEMALAEIAALDIVKARSADAVKLSEPEIDSINRTNALRLAAEIAAEFSQPDAAIVFRRALVEANWLDFGNQIALAELLAARGEKQEAANLLQQIIADRNSLRAARHQARINLQEIGVNAEISEAQFDAFSQFDRGLRAAKNGQNDLAAEFFLSSLTAEKDAEIPARRALIESYILSNKHYAALKLAATDNAVKSEEFLQMLSEAAEKIGDFRRAIDFEKMKSIVNEERIIQLQQLDNEKNRRATDLLIDLENTRKL